MLLYIFFPVYEPSGKRIAIAFEILFAHVIFPFDWKHSKYHPAISVFHVLRRLSSSIDGYPFEQKFAIVLHGFLVSVLLSDCIALKCRCYNYKK